jgi:hypothetical membrane protein
MGGTLLACLAVAVSAATYTGAGGEPYSFLNHFISELGEMGVSGNAWLFNAGLVVSGIFYVGFCVGLSLDLRGAWAIIGAVSGACSGVFCAGVGIFPMNDIVPHTFVAMWFFRCGLVTALLYAVGILAQPRGKVRVPRSASLLSVLAVAAFAVFLGMAWTGGGGGGDILDPTAMPQRPRVWTLAVSEWAVYAATIAWSLGVGLIVRLSGRGSATP